VLRRDVVADLTGLFNGARVNEGTSPLQGCSNHLTPGHPGQESFDLRAHPFQIRGIGAQQNALRELIVLAVQATMRITAMVAFILVGATCFSITFQGVDGNKWVEHLMSNLPGGVWGFLIVVNLFVFFLAFFLDFFEIAFIIVPMLAPVAQKLLTPVVGADAALIWFGVMLCVNMQTSFMHPPFGFALFYLRSVVPKEVKSSDIYWGSIPWVVSQLIMVALVIAFPITVTYFLDDGPKIDPSKVQIELQAPPEDDAPPPSFAPAPGKN